jgi:hypothetical protein
MKRHPFAVLGIAAILVVPRAQAAEAAMATEAAASAPASRPAVDCDRPKTAPQKARHVRRASPHVDPAPASCPVRSYEMTVTRQPAAVVPAMPVNGGDTCMGGPIDGRALRDDHCERLRSAALLWNFGQRDAALAMLCQDPQMRAALDRSGTACGVRAGTGADAERAPAAELRASGQ